MEWALGDGQLEWIKAQLSEAKSKKQLVCMFGHIPLTKNIHSSKCILWDSEKLQYLLKKMVSTLQLTLQVRNGIFSLEFSALNFQP